MESPPPFAQVMDDLIKGREFATQLQGLLRDSPMAGLIMDQILHTFSRAIHAARAAAATSASERSSDVQSEVTDGTSGGGKRKSASTATGGNRRACRRRTQQSSVVTKSMKSLDDGQAWRKYGQKEIQNSKHSRAYFRCTHKYDQLCTAQRQVQRCDDDEDMFRVTYIGVHTCRDPAAAVAPHVLHLTGTAKDLHAGCHLISFAPGSATGVTHGATTSTTTTMTLNTNLVDKDAAMGSGLQGLKLESGDQEEVLSSRTPGSSALHSTAAAATTPTWPDQGDVTSTLQYGGAGNFGELFDDYASLGDLVSYVLDH